MADDLLNGRPAADFELAALEHGRKCELDRDKAALAGLLAEFPPAAGPGVAAGDGPPGAAVSGWLPRP